MRSRRRADVTGRTDEYWQPPNFKPIDTRASRVSAAIRRFLDVQAGSIWTDLERELKASVGTVLDVGCGAQPYRPLVPDGVEYIGIDTADARDRFGYDTPDTRYFATDTWPIADVTIDTVLCTETLEHVLNPLAFLVEAHRCIRPGGRLILTVPFSARWHYIPHDYWRFTPSGLSHLLTASGLENVEVFPRGNAFTVACYKISSLIVPMLLTSRSGLRVQLRRLAAVLLLPALAAAVIGANLSLLWAGGDDCLGYTVLARRPGGVDRS